MTDTQGETQGKRWHWEWRAIGDEEACVHKTSGTNPLSFDVYLADAPRITGYLNVLEGAKVAADRELADVLLKDHGKTNEINILTKENRALCADLEALRQQLVALQKSGVVAY